MTGIVIRKTKLYIVDVDSVLRELRKHKEVRLLPNRLKLNTVLNSMLVDFPPLDNFSNAARTITNTLDELGISYDDDYVDHIKEICMEISEALYTALVTNIPEELLYRAVLVRWLGENSLILKI